MVALLDFIEAFLADSLLTDAVSIEEQERVIELVVHSHLSAVFESYFAQCSLFDVRMSWSFYRALCRLIQRLCTNDSLAAVLQAPTLSQRLPSALNTLCEIAGESDQSSNDTDELVALLKSTLAVCSARLPQTRRVGGKQSRRRRGTKDAETLRPLQYAHCSQVASNHHIAHTTLLAASSATRLRRIANELQSLKSELAEIGDSRIFVRVDEQRIDVISVLFIGPEGTPYAWGCFIFDILLPMNYPESPPLVAQHTEATFGRFSEVDSSICLWSALLQSGRLAWCPGVSRLRDVLLLLWTSLFVVEPYYQQTAERRISMNTSTSRESSQTLNSTILKESVESAMIRQIARPRKEFEDVIHAHFRLRSEKILRWLNSKKNHEFEGASEELRNMLALLNDRT